MSRAPYARNSATSRAAAREIEPHQSRLQRLILERLHENRRIVAPSNPSDVGMTCDELEWSLDLSHQTASARIRELALSGHIVPAVDKCGCPVRRKTRSGRSATVWVASGNKR